jgi:16S rRNA (cytosine967-C5)-methyltransferase
LKLKERRNVFTTEAFKNGLFEVQDGASQQVAPLLDVHPGMRVIDACAGAGGKTLHLAALLGNKGKIIALDVHARKLEELRKRCSRAGVDVVETRLIESAKTIKRLEKSADRVLLDVPCSGLGVLRRNPDTKWKISPEEITHLKALQAEILATYSNMVIDGGRLVYATCSCLPSENERQVESFLAANPGKWRLVEERKFAPGENGYDGFYAAALIRLS